jgi:hypothetical protein
VVSHDYYVGERPLPSTQLPSNLPIKSVTLSQFVHIGCSEVLRCIKIGRASNWGAEIMTTYRIYVVNPEGHVTDPPQIVECADDQEAMRQARQYLDSKPLEVWDGSKRVGSLKPRG